MPGRDSHGRAVVGDHVIYIGDRLGAKEGERPRHISPRRDRASGEGNDRSPLAAFEWRKHDTPASAPALGLNVPAWLENHTFMQTTQGWHGRAARNCSGGMKPILSQCRQRIDCPFCLSGTATMGWVGMIALHRLSAGD